MRGKVLKISPFPKNLFPTAETLLGKWEQEQLQMARELVAWEKAGHPMVANHEYLPTPDDLLELANREYFFCDDDGPLSDDFPRFEEDLTQLLVSLLNRGTKQRLSRFFFHPRFRTHAQGVSLFYINQVLLYWSDPMKDCETLEVTGSLADWNERTIDTLRDCPEVLKLSHAASKGQRWFGSFGKIGDLDLDALDREFDEEEWPLYLRVPRYQQKEGRPLERPRFKIMALCLDRHLRSAGIINHVEVTSELMMLAFPEHYPNGFEAAPILKRANQAMVDACKNFEHRFRGIAEEWKVILRRQRIDQCSYCGEVFEGDTPLGRQFRVARDKEFTNKLLPDVQKTFGSDIEFGVWSLIRRQLKSSETVCK